MTEILELKLALKEKGICSIQLLTRDFALALSDIYYREHAKIMNLPSYGFDKFPDGPANRLHLYNIFKFENEETKVLKKKIGELIKGMKFAPDQYWITGWFNYLKKGEELGWHSHEEDAQAFLSGVVFLSDHLADLILLDRMDNKVSLTDNLGRLVIFNSDLDHATHISLGDRLSLAFDIQKGPLKKSDLWCPLLEEN